MIPTGYTAPRYVVGVDLGRKTSRTAVAVVERVREVGERDPVDLTLGIKESYRVTHVERMEEGVLYLDVAARVLRLVEALRRRGLERVEVVVDETGLGRPVLEVMRAGVKGTRVTGVVITGSERETMVDGGWCVPRMQLLAGLRVWLEQRKLRVGAGVAGWEEVKKEVLGLRADGRGRGTDDLVMALALAVWRMGKA